MQPPSTPPPVHPEKNNTKGVLFVRMLVFEKYLVVLTSLDTYMPFEIRKRK